MKPMLKIIVVLIFSFANIFPQIKSENVNQYRHRLKSYEAYTCNSYTAIQDNISSPHHSFINLSGQLVVGSALAFGFSIVPVSWAFASGLSGNVSDFSQTALSILSISSYLFGAAVGVHWIASYENPDLSFWWTAGYSVIGGGIGAGLAAILATQYTTIPDIGVIIIALSPVIGSMLYASFISDGQQVDQATTLFQNSITHKDLFEQTKLFDIEILRIKF